MVPKMILKLHTLPKNASGKIDRQELASIARTEARTTKQETGRTSHRLPVTSNELSVQTIWAQVLNIDPDTIGLDDSFFRLGGDSLAAMRVVGEARKLRLDLTVADIFRSRAPPGNDGINAGPQAAFAVSQKAMVAEFAQCLR
jgi:hypothetical protein